MKKKMNSNSKKSTNPNVLKDWTYTLAMSVEIQFKEAQRQLTSEIHCENTPMQYTENFLVVKMKIFPGKILIFFLFLLKA